MPQPVEIKARGASPGFAVGEIVALERPAVASTGSGDAAAEAASLTSAIAAAVADLAHLIERCDEESAAMLEFQVAMLEDEALSGPALERIATGMSAARAWQETLDQQIGDYRAAEDEYFRARAADLVDILDRVLRHVAGGGEVQQASTGGILAGPDITPSRFLETDWSGGGGIALSNGSPSSHVAMLARARGVPMVVGLGAIDLESHARIAIDGGSGQAVLSPDEAQETCFRDRARGLAEQRAAHAAHATQPAGTRDGTPVQVLINVADPSELDALDPAICDGIGLTRTEFLFPANGEFPDEEAQYRAYRTLVEWAAGRPVTVRTLDAGGDKPIKGLTPADESNPFLGLRGIRLSLANEALFQQQLRALARAAANGPLKVMLPMVSVPAEFERASQLLDGVVRDLAQAGLAHARPPLGIMVEVPAVAVAPERFAGAEFLSIGTNDLTQYVMAAGRDTAAVADLADPADPAMLRLIAGICHHGRKAGIEVSLCGDMAADIAHTQALIDAGLRRFSVPAIAVPGVKAAISRSTADSA